MSWYVLDAVDRAIERTRICLIEPFDFWKWVKLALIVFFIGGSAGFNSGGNSYGGDSFDGSDSDFSSMPSGLDEIGNSIHDALSSTSALAIIVGIVLLVVLFALLLSIIGSVMEFVFVESLVYNDVHIISYFKKYLGQGLSLFILRVLIGLASLLLLGILLGSFLFIIMVAMGLSFSDLSGMGSDESIGVFFIMLFVFFAVAFLLAIITSMLTSFINLSIPVSMYSDCSIYSGLSRVLGQFKREWQQIIIYWIGRVILGIAVGIAIAILAIITAILVLIVLGLVALICYFVFSLLVSDTIVWILLIPILFVEFLLFIFVMALVAMPGRVFMKYHMLTFLQMWYPADLPFFDRNTESFVPEQMQIE